MNAKGFAEEVSEHRSYLMRFALAKLRDKDASEDVVQETLISALESKGKFEGRSTLRTWLTSILKNKILDRFRSDAKDPLVEISESEDSDQGDVLDYLFDSSGHWAIPPMAWADPHRSLDDKRFWAVFEACLDTLPKNAAQIFMLREVTGAETDEICKEVGISSSNCFVSLHRARHALRVCLEQRWFGGAQP